METINRSAENTPYTADDKLHWEVEKLKADVAVLKTPWIRSPQSWLAIAATVISVGGWALQFSTQELVRREAEVKATKAQSDRDLALIDKDKVDKEREAARLQLVQIKEEYDKLSKDLLVAKDPTTKPANKVESAAFRAEEAIASLNELSRANFDVNRGAFAVIASFDTLDRARSHVDTLKARQPPLPYPLGIFRRAQDRFAVTLGEASNPAEARSRVEFARSSGLATDAYVRFADNWGDNLNPSPSPGS